MGLPLLMAILEVQVERRNPTTRTKKKRIGKWIKNPLRLSGRNNGSQAHEINKWALKG